MREKKFTAKKMSRIFFCLVKLMGSHRRATPEFTNRTTENKQHINGKGNSSSQLRLDGSREGISLLEDMFVMSKNGATVSKLEISMWDVCLAIIHPESTLMLQWDPSASGFWVPKHHLTGYLEH